jgi:ATP-binding cassette subfamily B protein
MLAICFSLDARLTLYIALAVPFILAFVLFFFGRLKVFYDRHRKLHASIIGSVTEFIQGVEVLKAFGRVPWAEARLAAHSKARRDNDIKASILEYTTMGGLGFMIGPAFMAASVFLLAPQIFTGSLTIGTLMVFLDYGRRIFDPLMAISENIRSIQQARAALDRIFGIFDLPPESGHPVAASAENGLPAQAAERLAPIGFSASIEFRNVWFRYKEAEWVLEDVSFTIPKGSTLALVGPSGSGKTTTVALLCRFYEPERGEILVDGRPLKEIELEAWRRTIGLVLQDVYLFPGSILENVRVYDDAVSLDAVKGAIGAVQADDFVARLPEGLDKELRERGANLSGGERQLLSFARAIAFGPEIIVLDEATASIDVKTERKIREGMAELTSGRTAVIVAHRLSSVLQAEQILFFQKGRIVARGRHEELLAAFPDYAELVRLQFFAATAAGAEA